MYESFYGFAGSPFQLTPDQRFFFGSRAHSRAIAHLTFGLAQGEGFIIVTGEVGAGKTTLVERLWSQLDRDTYMLARIATTQLSGDDLFRLAMAGFGVETLHDSSDKARMIMGFEAMLRQQRLAGRRCLLVVDEAQNLSQGALEELRMLSNITEDGHGALQTILLGQPQFRRMLASPDLDQLRQRVLASYHLGPLGPEETQAYVEHRLTTVGWNGRPSFEAGTFDAIHRHAGGIPRRINRLCARVLLYGALEQTDVISTAMVQATAEELDRDLQGMPDSQEQAVETGFARGRPRLDSLGERELDRAAGRAALALGSLAGGATDELDDQALRRASGGRGLAPEDLRALRLEDLQERVEALELKVARRERVFQKLLDVLGQRA